MHARAGTLAESSGTRRHAQNGRTADAKNERDVAEHPPKKKKNCYNGAARDTNAL